MRIWHANRRLEADFTWVFVGNVVYGRQRGIVLALAKLGTAAQVGA